MFVKEALVKIMQFSKEVLWSYRKAYNEKRERKFNKRAQFWIAPSKCSKFRAFQMQHPLYIPLIMTDKIIPIVFYHTFNPLRLETVLRS